jgi:hypothetical protein
MTIKEDKNWKFAQIFEKERVKNIGKIFKEYFSRLPRFSLT